MFFFSVSENQKNVWSFDEIMTFPEHIHDDNFTHSGRHIPIALTGNIFFKVFYQILLDFCRSYLIWIYYFAYA